MVSFCGLLHICLTHLLHDAVPLPALLVGQHFVNVVTPGPACEAVLQAHWTMVHKVK
jgi:hypothetical protein